MKILYLNPSLNKRVIDVFYSINMWGALVVRVVCLRMTDIKKIIAYSSIIHINLLVIGLMRERVVGRIGAILMMISHGVSSPGIFTVANFNYEKSNSRNLLINKGLGPTQPFINLI